VTKHFAAVLLATSGAYEVDVYAFGACDKETAELYVQHNSLHAGYSPQETQKAATVLLDIQSQCNTVNVTAYFSVTILILPSILTY
jgi:hypothetical protein